MLPHASKFHPLPKLFICNGFEKRVLKMPGANRQLRGDNGVVYAVKPEKPYTGITEESGTIHSTTSINKDIRKP
jgi:hypothetical protein